MNEIPLTNKTFGYRVWEIIPAVLTWGTAIIIILCSFYAPTFITTIILAYVMYWFARTILMSGHLIHGFSEYRRNTKMNWFKMLETDPQTKDLWQDVWHIIIIANAKEEESIVASTLEALKDSHYQLDRLIIILATEARYHELGSTNAKLLEKKFGKTFAGFYASEHPSGLPNEVVGKGANITYAIKTLLPELKKKFKLPKEGVLVTTLDADNRVHPSYLAALTHTYLTSPDREYKSYQPLPMFFNNIWSVPFFIRLISVGSSFWQMIEATRAYRLRNFSAHSQTLFDLEKAGFWSTRTIVEDGHQYWRSYFATNGRYSVVPIFVPIYQDAVLSPEGRLMTIKEQYLQKRRWAYGVSDVPYVMTNLWRRRKEFPLDAWVQALRLMEGHFSWATTSLILAFLAWFPIWFNKSFQSTVFAYNFGVLYHDMLTLASLGMVITLAISLLLLPPRPRRSLTENHILESILTPIILPMTNIIFGSIPAIDAQTRLALGKYLGFRVTEKAAVRSVLAEHV